MQISRINSYNTYSNQKSNPITKSNNNVQQHNQCQVPFTGLPKTAAVCVLAGLSLGLGAIINDNKQEEKEIERNAIFGKAVTIIQENGYKITDQNDTNGDGIKELIGRGPNGETIIINTEDNEITIHSDGDIEKKEILKTDK